MKWFYWEEMVSQASLLFLSVLRSDLLLSNPFLCHLWNIIYKKDQNYFSSYTQYPYNITFAAVPTNTRGIYSSISYIGALTCGCFEQPNAAEMTKYQI